MLVYVARREGLTGCCVGVCCQERELTGCCVGVCCQERGINRVCWCMLPGKRD